MGCARQKKILFFDLAPLCACTLWTRRRSRSRDRREDGRRHHHSHDEHRHKHKHKHKHRRDESKSPRAEGGHSLEEIEKELNREEVERRPRQFMTVGDSDSESVGRGRSRSRSPRRKSRHRRASSPSSGSASDDAGSTDSSRSSSRRHRHKRRSRHRSKERGERKQRKHEKRKKHSKDKKDKKAKKRHKAKTPQELALEASKSASYGKYGVLRDSDFFEKQREFEAWLREVKGLPDSYGSKNEIRMLFREFAEGFNTATLQHEKFYDLAAWERQQLAHGRGAAAEGGGAAGLNPMADIMALQRERQAEKERAEAERTRLLLEGMDRGTVEAMRRQRELRMKMQLAYKSGDNREAERLKRLLDPDAK